MKREYVWPVTIVIALVIVALVVLSVLGKDTSGIIWFAGAALGAYGVSTIRSEVGQVKELSNGTLARKDAQIEKLTMLLAKSPALAPEDVDAITDRR